MKNKLLVFLFVLSFSMLFSQNYELKSLRYNEDFSFLKDSSKLTVYEKIKFIPLDKGKKNILSLGGEFRFQYQYFKNEDWGDIPNDKDGFILNRMLFHANLNLGNKFRIFTQLKNNSIQSREEQPKSIDVNALDINQSFIEYIPALGDTKILFRLGRQETMFGSQRLISVREGPNNRLTFDGVKTSLNRKNFKLDAFYLHPVVDRPEIMDDKWFDVNKIYGIYAVNNKVKWIGNIDLYYIGLYKPTAVFDEFSGKEHRHSIGTRIWQKKANCNLDFEAVYQFGKFENQSINAYTLSLNTSYEFDKIVSSPVVGFKTEIISGDKSKEDNQLNSFNPLYPRGAYFGLAALIGPVNLIDFHPYLDLKLTEKTVLGLDYDLFWRYSVNDGIYGPNVRPIYLASNSKNKFIGSQLGANLEYSPFQFLSIVVEGTWFDTGNYLQDVSKGKNIFFAALTVQFKY
jgi:Alginate export